MTDRLRDKVALVVGAGSVGEGLGNGKAAAMLFAREGAKIFAVDVDSDAAAETKAIIECEGGICATHQADATSAASVAAMVAACLARFERIDILHNNVGGSVPGGPVDMGEEAWDANIDLNLKTVFLSCKFVIPVMERQGGGAIVNISSVAGLRSMGGRAMVAYQASKAGLIQFSRAVAIQYAKAGIRSNCVVPGLMNTPLVAHRIVGQYGGGKLAETIAQRDAMCPTGKMGDAWDVAYAALYLASDEAKYVTATEILVDGGLTAKCD
ncbi:MAG: SDR family oxidoreductase [Alphaproteobacteria bacterium]|jgi:NAD(P)-dependent dehydrogenase (short-subunit alcohol dehydrogenase family)|nr:SDR family oxidoreductase [Alphaproteobacteria bacterium]